jgi:hypothetical protein
MRDPYECLAVPRTATAEEIEKSFRQLAKQLHPDANADPESTARFVELNAAHEILGDETRRRAFDRGEIDTAGQLVPIPSRRPQRDLWRVATMITAVLMLAAVSTLLVQRLMLRQEIAAGSEGKDVTVSRLGISENRADPPIGAPEDVAQPEARLILQQNDSYASGDTIPLGLQVAGDATGLAVEITGLPAGTRLSAGRQMGQGGWRLVATSVGNTMIHPPQGFRGALDFTAELRRADDTVVDGGSFRLEWSPTITPAAVGSVSDTAASSSQATANSAPTEQNANLHAAEPQLDREQIELLIGRSQKLMSEGDVGAARTLLQRAATAGDARAALALGATYDPIMLTILQARGISPDVAQAREWYKKAKELGSEEAEQRLRLLAPGDDGPEPAAVGRVLVSRNNEPASTGKDPTTGPAAAKRKNHVARPPSRNETSIRAPLTRDDPGRHLHTDVAIRQVPVSGAKAETDGN